MPIPKYKTTGKLGEKIFEKILKKHRIPYYDLSTNLKFLDRINIDCININGVKDNKIYFRDTHRHPFDFIVNNKNIEIKTSKYTSGKVNFNFQKNDKTLIDYAVAFVLLEEKLWKIYIFEKELIQQYQGICFNPLTNRKYKEYNEKDLINLLK